MKISAKAVKVYRALYFVSLDGIFHLTPSAKFLADMNKYITHMRAHKRYV